jgi:hypothetical protein
MTNLAGTLVAIANFPQCCLPNFLRVVNKFILSIAQTALINLLELFKQKTPRHAKSRKSAISLKS